MTQEGSPATLKPSENIDLQVVGDAGRRRESILVFVMVLAPFGLVMIVMAIGIAAMTAWQIARGMPVRFPTPTNIQLYGLLSYAVASWIAVAVVWVWSSRRGLSRDVFVFRRLTWPALLAGIAGSVIATYGVPL